MEGVHKNYTGSTFDNATTFGIQSILIGMFLGSFSLLTVSGNLLVILAVMRMRYLRSMTNYFIVSLAVADLLMGSIVMPFAALSEATHGYWPFGQDWCDLWHAFDVLSSTASILNLCMIAVERFWATENPITYPSKMTKKRCLLMVASVWICSSGISFPAIIWWRAVSAPINHNSTLCKFPEDRSYLFISSTISFYMPLMVMIFVYWRIFKTANDLVKSLNSGTKVIYKNGTSGEVMTLRIHRGGPAQSTSTDEDSKPKHKSSTSTNSHSANKLPYSQKNQATGQARSFSALSNSNSDYSAARMAHGQSIIQLPPDEVEDHHTSGHNTYFAKKLRNFALGKRLSKFAREQKAAKTLGIVMGIFIICWLPFFICILIIAVDHKILGENIEKIFTIVTWLGYINSSVNPIIYAHSMRDFRRAFIKILCAPCLRKNIDPFLAKKPMKSRSVHTLTSSSRTFTSRRTGINGRVGSICRRLCCCVSKSVNSPQSFSMSQTDQDMYGQEVEPLPKSGLHLNSPHIALVDDDSN